jgi:flagellar capping protein FliD
MQTPRKKIKYHLNKIDDDIKSIKSHLNSITDEIKGDYPHISTMIIVVDDTLNIIIENFINTLNSQF